MMNLMHEEVVEDGADLLAIGDAVVAIDRNYAVKVGLGQGVAEGDQLAVGRGLGGGEVDCAGERDFVLLDLSSLGLSCRRDNSDPPAGYGSASSARMERS